MVRHALFGASVLVAALLLGLLQVCVDLVPFRRVLLLRYGWPIGLYLAALLVNLTGALYWLNRAFFLKDTGRKLSHLEKQVRTRSAIVMELTAQLEDSDVSWHGPNRRA
jgi:hypothetical protein